MAFKLFIAVCIGLLFGCQGQEEDGSKQVNGESGTPTSLHMVTGKGSSASCWTCDGARSCTSVSSGQSTCKVEADDTGASCIASGKCGLGKLTGDFANFEFVATKTPESSAQEERINNYFQRNVIPKLSDCWGALSEKGVLIITHNYTRHDGGAWTPKKLEKLDYSLSDEQSDQAVACLREAVQGTSFTPDKVDGNADEFVLYWAWSVPLPSPK